ncbi:MAG: hypothetical protein CM15mV52_0910 [uncultured marine virus]|nr:MAG: hypothetical protein CM15mV52_0910 [uncultured marine virus]
MPNGFIGLTIIRSSTQRVKGRVVPKFEAPRAGDVMALQGGATGTLGEAMALWGSSSGYI